MGVPTDQNQQGSAHKSGPSDKLKAAYITAGATVAVAAITGAFALFSHRGDNSSPPSTGNTKVIIKVAPAASPPAPPAAQPVTAPVYNLVPGRCAYVFSEPKLLDEDRLGCVTAQTTVYIYCTVESDTVGNSTVWDEIYYKTNWGTTGYIPDYYVYTGTSNAVKPSCVT